MCWYISYYFENNPFIFLMVHALMVHALMVHALMAPGGALMALVVAAAGGSRSLFDWPDQYQLLAPCANGTCGRRRRRLP